MKLRQRFAAALLVAAGVALAPQNAAATPVYSWDDGYARTFTAADIQLDYRGDWFYAPVLLVGNGAAETPLLARTDSDADYEIPSCPFTRDGYVFVGWKMFDACVYPSAASGTITSCVLPSGETYDWSADGYVGERLPGEYIEEPCGVMVLVAQWREVAANAKYRLTVAVDPKYKGGSVSGGGTYAPGATVTLKATPKKGYVFSEWETTGTTDVGLDRWDLIKWETGAYQNPSVKIKMPAGATKVVARFIKTGKDYIENEYGDGVIDWYTVDDSEFWDQLSTGSRLVSVKASGVPKGISFARREHYLYVLRVTKASLLVPGKTYSVTVAVKTASGKTRNIKIRIHAKNRTTAVDKGALTLDTYYDGYDGGYRLRAGTKFNWTDLGIQAADGWKITKVTGLPAGLKWNAASQKMTGVPSKKGTYTVMFTVTKGKTSYTASATFKVAALPSAATGTFTGYTTSRFDWGDGLYCTNLLLSSHSRAVTVSITAAGKITAKIGSLAFSGTGLTRDDDGRYTATVKKTTKSGKYVRYDTLTFTVDPAAAWNTFQLNGMLWATSCYDGNCIAGWINRDIALTAQRNPFGKNASKKYVNAAAGKIATRLSKYGSMKTDAAWIGTGVYDLAGPGCGLFPKGYKFPLAFKVSTAGQVTVSGKVGGLAVSGSTTLKIAPSTWTGSPWAPYEYVYDEATDTENWEYTGTPFWQADFCLTASKKPVRIHVEFSPENGVCRHGWATVGSHAWDEYYATEDGANEDD